MEALVRYVKSNLVPEEGFASLNEANREAATWCGEVNAQVHEETRAVPTERLEQEGQLGHAAVDAGYRVRFFRADALVEQLYRGLADNSVGRVIDSILRADLVLVDELGCAPRGADVPCGMRGPPPTFAAVGRS